MGIGFTVYIEFSMDAFASVAANRCATPGGTFFWHHPLEMEIFGLPISERVRLNHPFGLRGIPKCLSRDVVRLHYVLITENAPQTKKGKYRNQRFSIEDKVNWENQGFQFWPIANDPLYEIKKLETDELLFHPGLLCPSWLTAKELKTVLYALNINLEQLPSEHSDRYNASVFNWMFSLGDIYGDDNVRMVYWFDSLPDEILRESMPRTPI